MPKKTMKKVKAVQVKSQSKKDADFFFLVTVSVFAALTVFAANYLAQAKQEAQARRAQPLPVAQLDLATPNPPQYKNVTPKTK